MLIAAVVFSAPAPRAPTVTMTATSPTRVVALDFDGVLCDSEPELTATAWKASCQQWPETMEKLAALDPKAAGARRAWTGGDWKPQQGTLESGLPNWLATKMRVLRPTLETGYESMLMMKLCADEALAASNDPAGRRPLTPGEIQANWDSDMRDMLLVRYGLSPDEAVELYGATRDTWLEEDESGWLGTNKFYEGAIDALRDALSDDATAVYIVTTKQRRFAQALLRSAGIEIADERVYGLGSGPKATTLAELQRLHPGVPLAFVEDRVQTLRSVANELSLFGCELYFAQWGYSTPEQQAWAASFPRVRDLGAESSGLARALRGESVK